jgi:hypothetical protein
MITKRYTSPCARFFIQVKRDGKRVQLSFDGYDTELKKRFFDTSDYEIQKQLEASPDFNVYFHLDSQVWDEPIVKEEVVTSIVEFKTAAEAREWLYKNKKVPLMEMSNKAKIVEIAKGLGFEFTFKTDLK